ncbi:MAG: hypothetical protein ACYDHX_04720 [Methanothrix sp.]
MANSCLQSDDSNPSALNCSVTIAVSVVVSSNPTFLIKKANHNRLWTSDPVCRKWAALRSSKRAYRGALAERRALGYSDFFHLLSPNRRAGGDNDGNPGDQDSHDRWPGAGCAVLEGQQEPTVKGMQSRITHLRRQNSSQHPEYRAEAVGLEALIALLEEIANSCFQVS